MSRPALDNFIHFQKIIFLYLSDYDGENKLKDDNEVISLGVQEQHQLRMAKAIRQQTVEKLWEITEKLNILYKDNWTALAEREMIKFQAEIFSQQKADLESTKPPAVVYEDNDEADENSAKFSQDWSFASSFLYSLTLITTVGKQFYIEYRVHFNNIRGQYKDFTVSLRKLFDYSCNTQSSLKSPWIIVCLLSIHQLPDVKYNRMFKVNKTK